MSTKVKPGALVTYIHQNKEITGILVAIDPEIGITIAIEKTPEKNCVCLHGPKAPSYLYHRKFYKEFYDHVVHCIENDLPLTEDALIDIMDARGFLDGYSSGGMVDCAFS